MDEINNINARILAVEQPAIQALERAVSTMIINKYAGKRMTRETVGSMVADVAHYCAVFQIKWKVLLMQNPTEPSSLMIFADRRWEHLGPPDDGQERRMAQQHVCNP